MPVNLSINFYRLYNTRNKWDKKNLRFFKKKMKLNVKYVSSNNFKILKAFKIVLPLLSLYYLVYWYWIVDEYHGWYEPGNLFWIPIRLEWMLIKLMVNRFIRSMIVNVYIILIYEYLLVCGREKEGEAKDVWMFKYIFGAYLNDLSNLFWTFLLCILPFVSYAVKRDLMWMQVEFLNFLKDQNWLIN